MAEQLRASVVIPCLNEEQKLPGVLDALLAQEMPREEYEVMVVDGGSRDRTVEIAESRGVRVISSDRGVGRQRNRGAAEARSQHLVFLDADCEVGGDWLGRGVARLEQGAALAGGPIESAGSPTWVGRTWDFHNATRRRRLADQPHELYRLITTANMFVRRDVFEQVGGLDESLGSGEDYLFCHQVEQLNKEIVFDEKIPVQHIGQPETMGSFFKEQVWHSNRDVWKRLRSCGDRSAGQAAYRYGLLTAALLVALLICGAVSAAFLTPWPAAVAAAVYVALPTALSVRTCSRAGNLRPLVPLAVLYLLYGLARAVYLLGILRLGYRRD